MENVKTDFYLVHPALSLDWTGLGFCPSFGVVPSATKNSGRPPVSIEGDMPFEEALQKLEAIVEAMESEDLPLETLMTKYADGTRLAKVCQAKLAEAEVRIQQLEKDAAGELTLKPLTSQQSESEK